mgnify:CR=1
MEKLTGQIDAAILILQEARADADKCDKGKMGAPGTRLRKTAQDIAKRMKDLRADVLSSRKEIPQAKP